ncbi:SixA phosphatase family protein [Jatrophihabitans sp. DSM 45814]
MAIEHTLVILRHAKATEHVSEGGAFRDLDRPLAPRGLRDAQEAGRWLRDNLGELELVVCSPAVRAQQTWESASTALGYAPELREEDVLYAEPVEDLIDLIHELPAWMRTVAFVGHNPELSQLASALSGTETELSTASIAVLDFEMPWTAVAEGAARLRASVTARAH